MTGSFLLAARFTVPFAFPCALLGVLGCGQLLDIPADPTLRAASDITGNAPGPSSDAGSENQLSAAPGTFVGPQSPGTLDASLSSNSDSERSGPQDRQSQPQQTTGTGAVLASDAGASAVRDANAPVPDSGAALPERDAQVSVPCATQELLGPNQRCHFYNSEALSWEAARQACVLRGNGWNFSEIFNAADNAFASAMVSPEAWVGASDATVEEDWRWVTSDTPFWLGNGDTGNPVEARFNLFSGGEPNGETGSNCLRLRDTGTWADRECDVALPSLCMGPARQ